MSLIRSVPRELPLTETSFDTRNASVHSWNPTGVGIFSINFLTIIFLPNIQVGPCVNESDTFPLSNAAKFARQCQAHELLAQFCFINGGRGLDEVPDV